MAKRLGIVPHLYASPLFTALKQQWNAAAHLFEIVEVSTPQLAIKLREGHLVNFRYDLNDEALSALNEFFRMEYYHGILKDILEVKLASATLQHEHF